MSKRPRIDWNKGGKEELAKAIRNYNAKIARVAKKNPKSAGSLPEKVRLTDYVGTKNKPGLIQTRADLKREIKSLKRFSNKGAEELVDLPNNEYGTQITKWQKKEIGIRRRIANRRRKERAEMLQGIELESGGQPLGYSLNDIGMGKQDLNQVRPIKDFSRTATNRDVKARWRSLRRETQSTYYDDKDAQVKENYVKALLEHYNQDDVQDILDAVDDMPLKDFMKRFRQSGNTFEIVSPTGNAMVDLHNQINYEGYVELLRTTWVSEKPKGTAKQARKLTGNKDIKAKTGKQSKTKKG